MGTWMVQETADEVVLRYVGEDNHIKDCGRGPLVLRSELMAWVMEQAQAFDQVRTTSGVFFKQTSTASPRS